MQLLKAKAAELAGLGFEVLAVPGDVSSTAAAVVASAMEQYGRLDILVNNAAISAGLGIEEITQDAWRRVMTTNLDGAFEMVRHAFLLFGPVLILITLWVIYW